MNAKLRNIGSGLLIFLLGCLVYANGLNVHGFEFRDDEVFYKKSTQEMVATGEILSPKYFGEDRFQKPILYYWFILAAYRVFGVSWFAARITSCLFAAGALVLTWLIAKSLFDRRTGYVSVFILMTMPLFFRHAKNAVPDMALNFFIVLALYLFIRFVEDGHRWRFAAGFFLACGAGFMVKGFAALLFPYLTVILYAVWERDWSILRDMRFFRGTLLFLAVVLPWFIFMTVVHGSEYIEYMWFRETTDRLLKVEEGHFVLRKIGDFLRHFGFYVAVLFQQYAPWCLVSGAALVAAFVGCRRGGDHREPYRFLMLWIATVIVFFSFMYFTISHYMLVLSTPLAIATAAFVLRPLPDTRWLAVLMTWLRRHLLFLAYFVLLAVYVFVLLFFGGAPLVLAGAVGALGVTIGILGIRTPGPVAPVALLAALLAAVMFQTPYLSQLGLTTHTAWRKFAGEIQRRGHQPYTVGVASHDLHEKELQIYFPSQRIGKYANDNEEYTVYMLRQLFGNKQRVYCLMTEKDYNKYLKDTREPVEIIRRDYMLRKRLNIDGGFFMALLRLDRRTIFHYFMENVVLIKREQSV